ncbi:O-antigen ligase family protein [Planctomonas psychrotolerans]|uniref:O-antigen ligase family protein n=1 Tax=Planctomonas psychrotolerans TaxID=2528712 RepID=UPI0012396B1C|nr:O-antigen ligase family protein [Planctomonas psychrotolerans]
MTANRERTAGTGLAVLVWFSVLAGDAWRNSLSWYGYGAVVFLLLLCTLVHLSRVPDIRWRTLPVPLMAFLALATASIAWSFYPAVSAAGVAIQWATTIAALFLTLSLRWTDNVAALGTTVRFILAASLAFELIAAAVLRRPLFPFFTDYGGRDVPDAYYWTRAELFEGGRIQGIVGNSNLLGMIALLALIVIGVQLACGTVRRRTGYSWLVVAVTTFALARSATAFAALLVTLGVLAVALIARRLTARGRLALAAGVVAAGAVGAVAVSAWSARILGILGRSPDLTGRLDIWAAVRDLAVTRPVAGWGWTSYWAPWVEPFDDLALRNGVRYLQAHNAYLDVWFQLGAIGLAVFLCLVLSTAARAWWIAIDRPQRSADAPLPFSAMDLLPVLLLAALLTQSLAESRILLEGGWVLLCVLAVATKLGTARSEYDPPKRTPRSIRGIRR